MRNFLKIFIFFISFQIFAQVKQDYYLNSNNEYNPKIPTPQSVLGHQVGEWHVSHDKLSQYMHKLAAVSNRISIENRGSTYEGRPILLLTITDPENHKNIKSIKKTHIDLTEFGSENLDVDKLPIIVYQGFSIHGNEPSGANAGILAAYHLAASESYETKEMLKNTAIMIVKMLQ